MSELTNELFELSSEFLKVANEMHQSCLRKENKVYSDSRYIISFYFRRAIEMFESFIVLTKEQRLTDSAVLLRSFWELGINTGFIYHKRKNKELNSLRYLLDEHTVQKKIINANLQEFKETDDEIEQKRDEIIEDTFRVKRELCKKYCEQDWKLPGIEERAKKSGLLVLYKAYNQVYRYLSNIEHHNIFFGKNYVDEKNCEPLKKLKENPLLAPDLNLIMFQSIFLEILKKFNEEFQLSWKDKLSELGKKHGEKYKKMQILKSDRIQT